MFSRCGVIVIVSENCLFPIEREREYAEGHQSIEMGLLSHTYIYFNIRVGLLTFVFEKKFETEK
jgi:hypothetical protein